MVKNWINTILLKLSKKSTSQLILLGTIGTLILIIISTLFIGASDEMLWVLAGERFRQALIEFRLDKTFLPDIDRLGLSVLWVSTLIDTVFQTLPLNNLLIIHRFVFLTLNLSFFVFALKILRPYVPIKVCGLLVIYMFLDRFFPLVGRSSWLDQFLTSFGLLTIIFWIKYLLERKRLYLITASIFNGLLLLTKYAGWYFAPIIIIISLIYCYKTHIDFKKLITPLVIFLCFSLIIFVIFYPAIWVGPYKVLFSRLGDRSMLVQKSSDIWAYLSEIKLLDPVLILGSFFVILDWRTKKIELINLVGLAGLLYLNIYLITFFGLLIFNRLDYSFLEGLYRYTFPAIPFLALYTFYRYPVYIKNKDLQFAFVLFLFVWEIIFSPFLLFGRI